MLQEVIDTATEAAEEKNEMEELKLLLPDIREKVEDAKESQRTGSAASQAIQQTLVSTQVDQEISTVRWWKQSRVGVVFLYVLQSFGV